jgi:hypothetical protein
MQMVQKVAVRNVQLKTEMFNLPGRNAVQSAESQLTLLATCLFLPKLNPQP